jgi:hypothetical protein
MSAIVSDDASAVGGELELVPVAPPTASSRFSWTAAVAGAFAATAVTFLIISLGSGIGLSIASPYRVSPSSTTLTLIGAIWLLMAQAFGFACGGYLAARMRSHFVDDASDEGRFRDAAQGFLVWSLGVVITALFVVMAGLYTASTATNASANLIGAAASGSENGGSSVTSTIDYFVDMLFRPGPSANAGATNDTAAASNQSRAEAGRVLAHAITQGQLNNDDRSYLAQLVSQRTALSQDEAQQRVTNVESQARDAVKQAADKTAKAGAYLSFWTFMSLLFGAVAAVLGGVLGGESRLDDAAWSPTIQPR